jgi:hypothetical protein
VKTNLGSDDDEVWELATSSNGDLFVLASTNGTAIDPKLLKYDALGNLDTSFGSSEILDLNLGADIQFYDLVIASMDELLISGIKLNATTNENEVIVAKIDAQGTLVNNFSNSGRLIINDPLENYNTKDIITTADGGLLISGAVGNSSINTQLALYKLTQNGALDRSFNTTSCGYYDHGSSNYGVTFGYSMAQWPDGSYIVQADIIGNNKYDV